LGNIAATFFRTVELWLILHASWTSLGGFFVPQEAQGLLHSVIAHILMQKVEPLMARIGSVHTISER